MGCYVNPHGESKEAWLNRHGRAVLDPPPYWGNLPGDQLPVCLVDTGHHTAAGVAFSKREYLHMLQPDGRPKVWYLVKIDDLKTVSELESWLAHDGQ